MGSDRGEGVLPAEIERHRFDVEEYCLMAEVRILSEDDRVELIDGEIVEMSPIGGRRINCVNRLNRLLVEFSARRYEVSVQNPLRLDNEREFETGLSVPMAGDALLVIEVAETSLSRNRNIKLPRYARAGVPEVWLVDLGADRIELYAGAGATGSYAIARTYARGETVRSETVPGLALDVDEILGGFVPGEHGRRRRTKRWRPVSSPHFAAGLPEREPEGQDVVRRDYSRWPLRARGAGKTEAPEG